MNTTLRSADPTPLGFPRISALILLLAVHAVFAIAVVQPGHFSTDEVIYHQMVRSLELGTWPEIRTGFEEFPSAELRHHFHKLRDGALIPQYPYLHSVLAWPFYKVAGYRGLFALNALALVGVAAVCFAAARRMYGSVKLAADAVIILLLATFMWQYGHAAWPHALSALFVGGAALLAIMAAQEEVRSRAIAYSAAAGLVIGIGAGVRLDTVFILPALTFPFLFATPARPREAVAAALGAVPGLLVLALTNLAKFGALSPFTYGDGTTDLVRHAPPAIIGVISLGILWIVTRPRISSKLKGKPLLWTGVLLLGAAAILLLPPLFRAVLQLADGVWQLLVDFRIRDPNIVEAGLTRGPLGGMVYSGAVKKSLLQSLPWLPAAMLAAAMALRPWRAAMVHQIAVLVIVGYFGFYAYTAWHGGMSFNLRYFVPFLPFIAIYGARGAHVLADGADRRALGAAFLLGVATFVTGIILLYRDLALESSEPLILNTPLWLAALLAIAVLAFALTKGSRRLVRGVAVMILAVCFSWSAVVSISYDFLLATGQRAYYASLAAQVAPHIEADSILFTEFGTPYFTLIDMGQVRIAAIRRDDFAGFRKLVDHHLAAERPVYATFDQEAWDTVRDRGYLTGIVVTELVSYDEQTLARLNRAEGN
jgi:hypothetical protein